MSNAAFHTIKLFHEKQLVVSMLDGTFWKAEVVPGLTPSRVLGAEWPLPSEPGATF